MFFSSTCFRWVCLGLVVVLGVAGRCAAQAFPFTSGPIPMCDTSTYTANVSGIGTLYPPGTQPWAYSIDVLTINITSDHPQTLQVFLTSPQGTELLLSQFNGAGGQNYTNTNFVYNGSPSITTGSAPFDGYWTAQGGPLSIFDGENANGAWTITVIDTACANGGTGPGGTWVPGWFNGGGGGFSFGFYDPGPWCWGGIPSDASYLCEGDTVDVLGYYNSLNTGYDITVNTWGMPPGADPTAVTESGTYFVEAYDMWSGCYYTADFQVFVSPQIVLGPDQVVEQCSGAAAVDMVALFNTAGAAQVVRYLNGVPLPPGMAATAPGVYQVVGSNGGGCNDTALVTLNIHAAPSLGPDQTPTVCAGGSVDLTALFATTGGDLEWTFGGAVLATPQAATEPGVYTVVNSTLEGCTDTATVTLAVEAAPLLGADGAANLCDNAALDLTTFYTTAGLTASWTYIGMPILTPSTVYQGGTYQLVASSAAGCTDTALVAVTLNQSPTLGGDLIDTTCEGVAADLTIFYPTAGLTTAWTNAGVPVPDPTQVYAAGYYTLVATNASGCMDTAQTEITVDPLPVLGPDQAITACEGVVVDLTTLYNTGSNTVEWTLNGAAIAHPASVTSGGIYTLTATSTGMCSATAAVTLALEPRPALGADVQVSICAGSTIDLGAFNTTSGLAAVWTLNGVPVDEQEVGIGGMYQLVVTNTAGCTDTALVALAVDPGPALGGDLSFSLCPWRTVDLSVVFPLGDHTSTYTLNGVAVPEPTAVHAPGTYVVTATNANGCTDVAMAFVDTIPCLCEVDFTHNADCLQDPVQFILVADSVVVAAQWHMGGAAGSSTEFDPLVLFTAEGDVLVTLEATLSCGVVSLQRSIHVQDCSDSCSVWLPSAFTPDGDTRNDTWTWRGECAPEDFSMEIYDRWGERLFRSTDPMKEWDGTSGGTLSPSGVYAYRVAYRLPYQKRKVVSGAITLVR